MTHEHEKVKLKVSWLNEKMEYKQSGGQTDRRLHLSIPSVLTQSIMSVRVESMTMFFIVVFNFHCLRCTETIRGRIEIKFGT